MDFTIFNGERYGVQCIATARASDAFARVNKKQRVMGGALYQCFIKIKKLVFLPFEAGTSVWAMVVKSKKFTILVYHKDRLDFTSDFKLKTFAAGVFDISGFAENVGHDVW